MSLKKSALGRGLGALIEDARYETKAVLETASTGSISLLSMEQIEVNQHQPRTHFDQEALSELSTSIKQLGVIQPITVRKLENEKFQIISGERRFRASKLAGLTQIPAFVREADDNAMLEFALVENIQREDLNAIEVAISYQRLIDECKLTQENMSDRVGKKRSTISNYLRLLKLPPQVQAAIRDKQISMGHARAMINIESSEQLISVYERVVNEGLSVRSVEEIVRKINNPEPVKVVEAVIEPIVVHEHQPISEINDVSPISIEDEITLEDVRKQQDKLTDPTLLHQEAILPQEEVIIPIQTVSKQQTPANNWQAVEIPTRFVQFRERLVHKFRVPVDIKREESGKGRLILNFDSDADFERIIQLMETLQEQQDTQYNQSQQ